MGGGCPLRSRGGVRSGRDGRRRPPEIEPLRTDAPILSIVVPTYNERDRLGELVASIVSVWRDHGIAGEIVIVDDNSPDGTGQWADELATRYPLQVVHRPGKLGLGSAVMEGFAAARGGVVGVMDADLSHPPDALPRMLSIMEETSADFIIGSRYLPGGGTYNFPVSRLAMSRLACLLARPITPVRDATSGFFLVRREVMQDVTIKAKGFKICLELLLRGRARSIVEVPYRFAGREAGHSKMSGREAVGYLRQLVDLYRHRFLGEGRRRRPAYQSRS